MNLKTPLATLLVGSALLVGCGSGGDAATDKGFFDQLNTASAKNPNGPKTKDVKAKTALAPGEKSTVTKEMGDKPVAPPAAAGN